MIGRQVIATKNAFTLEELYHFMQERWDPNEYNYFEMGDEVSPIYKGYIVLPATPRFLVIVYPKAAGGLFNKENKVVLTVTNTPEGYHESFSLTERDIFRGRHQNLIKTIAHGVSSEQERKGPAEEILQEYTAYMTQLLGMYGYLK